MLGPSYGPFNNWVRSLAWVQPTSLKIELKSCPMQGGLRSGLRWIARPMSTATALPCHVIIHTLSNDFS